MKKFFLTLLSLTIINLNGLEIMTLANETISKGSCRKSFSTKYLSQGIFILQISHGTNIEHHKIVVRR